MNNEKHNRHWRIQVTSGFIPIEGMQETLICPRCNGDRWVLKWMAYDDHDTEPCQHCNGLGSLKNPDLDPRPEYFEEMRAELRAVINKYQKILDNETIKEMQARIDKRKAKEELAAQEFRLKVEIENVRKGQERINQLQELLKNSGE